MNDFFSEANLMMTRRQLFGRTAMGLGTAAMAGLMGRETFGAPAQFKGGIHHLAKAKRVIYLFMSGGPSHLDLWDYKPKMREMYGKDLPKEVRDGQRITGMTSRQKNLPVCPTKYKFTKQENNADGVWVSELLPHTATVAKELCVVHTAFTEAINHDPAITYIQSGSQIPGRPSLGAWLSYGLGSMNENLPSYVVMHARTRHPEQSLFGRLWGSGFMSSQHQGVLLRSQGDPVLYLNTPAGVTREDRRAQLDALSALNKSQQERFADPSVLDRIKQHEMAYRMQSSVPELMDLGSEPQHILEMYGIKDPKEANYARNCLLARRLIERGVRFVQLFHEAWDQHGNLTGGVKKNAADTDKASSALVKDLKQQGLLNDTLVVWGGEFGRTPMVQGSNDGRDHHNRSYSMWLAGGGIKSGHVHGETDELGFNVVNDPVHVHDLNATLLHLLGLDHERLTYRFQGRDFRLTDVHGTLVPEILA